MFSGGSGSASGTCSVNSSKMHLIRDWHEILKATKPTFLMYPELLADNYAHVLLRCLQIIVGICI